MNKKFKAYIGALLVANTMGATLIPEIAVADVVTAEKTAVTMGIDLNAVNKKYFADADFAINIEEHLTNITNGKGLPSEYAERGFVPNTALVQNGLNEMRGVVANANIANAFTNPAEFKYVSMLTMFANSEQLKLIGSELDVMLTNYFNVLLAGNPEATADAAQEIFTFARKNEGLLGVGGTQGIASDMSVVDAMATTVEANKNELGMTYDEWKNQVTSYLNNANAIALADYYFSMIQNTKTNCR